MEFTELVNQPDSLYGVPDVAVSLGMSRTSAALVVASGVGGPFFQKGSRRDIHSALVPATTLKRLAATPSVGEHPEALVVRVRPARVDPDDPARPFMGWHPDATWDDQALGVGRWWRVRDPEHWHGKTLLATVVGFAVHVAKIESHENAPGGSVAFHLVPPDDDALEAFQGRRLEITQGGVIVHLPASEGWSR